MTIVAREENLMMFNAQGTFMQDPVNVLYFYNFRGGTLAFYFAIKC